MVAAILEVAVVPYVCAFAIFSKTSESFTPTDKGSKHFELFNMNSHYFLMRHSFLLSKLPCRVTFM